MVAVILLAVTVPSRPVVDRSVLWLLLLQSVWAALSMVWAGTADSQYAIFAWLDQLVVPGIMYLAGVVAFNDEPARRVLLRSVVVVAVYVGGVSVLQFLGVSGPMIPQVLSEDVGSDVLVRAGGPFGQVGANGAALAMSIPFAALVIQQSKGGWRVLGMASLVLSLAGCFLTLTRSVWIAAILSLLFFLAANPSVRRWLMPSIAGLGVAVYTALVLSSALLTAVVERVGTSRSIDDRAITNAAAADMSLTYPLTGVGWGHFLDVVDDWVLQPDADALTNTHIIAHNILLSRAAELGLAGACLLAAAVLLGPVRQAVLLRKRAPEWTAAVGGAFVGWFVIAMLTPMGYAYANYMLWLMAGVIAGRWSRAREGRHRDGLKEPSQP